MHSLLHASIAIGCFHAGALWMKHWDDDDCDRSSTVVAMIFIALCWPLVLPIWIVRRLKKS